MAHLKDFFNDGEESDEDVKEEAARTMAIGLAYQAGMVLKSYTSSNQAPAPSRGHSP